MRVWMRRSDGQLGLCREDHMGCYRWTRSRGWGYANPADFIDLGAL